MPVSKGKRALIPFSPHNIYKVISINYLLMLRNRTDKTGSHLERGEAGIRLKSESGSLKDGADITGSYFVEKTIKKEADSHRGVGVGVGVDNSFRSKRCGGGILKCTIKRE
jgi:hypothetical protein